MDKKPILLLASGNPKYRLVCAKKLELHGFDVVPISSNGCDIARNILRYYPDIVIMDYIISEVKAIEILEFSKKNLITSPSFIVTGEEDEQEIIKELRTKGMVKYFQKPFSMNLLCKEAIMIGRSKNFEIGFTSSAELDMRIDREINLVFRDIGMPLHLNGTIYLKESIFQTTKDPEQLIGITKVLYQCVAKKYKTSVAAVESCIRKSIGNVWKYGNIDVLTKYFYLHKENNLKKKRPSNLEFISIIANNVSIVVSEETMVMGHDELVY